MIRGSSSSVPIPEILSESKYAGATRVELARIGIPTSPWVEDISCICLSSMEEVQRKHYLTISISSDRWETHICPSDISIFFMWFGHAEIHDRKVTLDITKCFPVIGKYSSSASLLVGEDIFLFITIVCSCGEESIFVLEGKWEGSIFSLGIKKLPINKRSWWMLETWEDVSRGEFSIQRFTRRRIIAMKLEKWLDPRPTRDRDFLYEYTVFSVLVGFDRTSTVDHLICWGWSVLDFFFLYFLRLGGVSWLLYSMRDMTRSTSWNKQKIRIHRNAKRGNDEDYKNFFHDELASNANFKTYSSGCRTFLYMEASVM